jgi:predicted kinase
MSTLVLVRGLPGSGKSTFARALSTDRKGWRHVEADIYHTLDDGTYNWRPENVKAAHRWCQDTARELLSDGFNVVVSNTFTQMWEMEPYVKMAQ